MNYLLVTSRWVCDEFVFIEYGKDIGVFVDVGPFATDPSDEETEQGYRYLLDHCPPFLNLGETEWALDGIKLTEEIPELKSQSLNLELSHPPAFETASFIPLRLDRLLTRTKMIRFPSATGSERIRGIFDPSLPGECYFLRITFRLQGTSDSSETKSETAAEDVSDGQELDQNSP